MDKDGGGQGWVWCGKQRGKNKIWGRKKINYNQPIRMQDSTRVGGGGRIREDKGGMGGYSMVRLANPSVMCGEFGGWVFSSLVVTAAARKGDLP